MTVDKKRTLAGVITAAGAVGAYFGVRALMRWMQRRQLRMQYQERFPESRRRFAESLRGYAEGGRVESPRYQPQTQPDREAIPATGMTMESETPLEMDMLVMVETGQPYIEQQVTTGDLAGPLVQYLLAFHTMIHRVHLRRWENQPGSGPEMVRRSLTAEDRARYQDTLDRLSDQLPDLSGGDLPDRSPQQRMYNLAVKVRDALQNRSYSDDDLFRINGEVRSEACQVLDELIDAGPEIMEARKAYECS